MWISSGTKQWISGNFILSLLLEDKSSILFFKSDVYFNKCEFIGDVSGDDMLNIVNAKFKLSNSRFKHTFSDAFDGDFVQGEIINTEFNKVGNDGIDFSGSVIKGSYIKFKNIDLINYKMLNSFEKYCKNEYLSKNTNPNLNIESLINDSPIELN